MVGNALFIREEIIKKHKSCAKKYPHQFCVISNRLVRLRARRSAANALVGCDYGISHCRMAFMASQAAKI